MKNMVKIYVIVKPNTKSFRCLLLTRYEELKSNGLSEKAIISKLYKEDFWSVPDLFWSVSEVEKDVHLKK